MLVLNFKDKLVMKKSTADGKRVGLSQTDTHDCERFLLSCCGTQSLQTVAALLLAGSKHSPHFRNESKAISVVGKCLDSALTDLHVAFVFTRQTFNLVSTKPALSLANQPMLTSRASSLACPRQKPVWSSYGCKHHPGAAALPEV